MVVLVIVFAFAVVVEDAVAVYQLFVSLADAFASIVAAVFEVAVAVWEMMMRTVTATMTVQMKKFVSLITTTTTVRE
jgi:hypothetical protein